MANVHSCGDSRLKCIECAAQVCPECYVQCPVGNRCRKCAPTSTKSPPRVAGQNAPLKIVLGALVIGTIYGALHYQVSFIFFEFIFYFVFLFAGLDAGQRIGRDKTDKTPLVALFCFCAGVVLANVGVAVSQGYSPLAGLVLSASFGLDLLSMIIGFVLGRFFFCK